jgi:hypothetical protein
MKLMNSEQEGLRKKHKLTIPRMKEDITIAPIDIERIIKRNMNKI